MAWMGRRRIDLANSRHPVGWGSWVGMALKWRYVATVGELRRLLGTTGRTGSEAGWISPTRTHRIVTAGR